VLADELARQQADALERGISLDSEQAAGAARQAELQRQGTELAAQFIKWEEAQMSGRAGQEQLLAQDFCLSDNFATPVTIEGPAGSRVDNNTTATKHVNVAIPTPR